ncbi:MULTISPECIES: hypothetical protein [unclassified Streptomyces]|uniref:hypothetical protein n=1 Tax=unclassified Streptomyces TaxID=2593676 RepID=UPI000559D5A4|nr:MULTISPECIES: hypothetical protein [unclassified Streptomyces]MYY03045.1 hypothetical protein [Streptomyces sp. SID4913]
MSGAHVVLEEADDTGEDGLQVTRVRVNGTDVGRLHVAPEIHVGSAGARDLTTITLTLVPAHLEIRGEHADGDRREPRAGFTAKIN